MVIVPYHPKEQSNSHLIPSTTCNKWQTIEMPSTFTSLIPIEVAAGVGAGSMASQRDFPSFGLFFFIICAAVYAAGRCP